MKTNKNSMKTNKICIEYLVNKMSIEKANEFMDIVAVEISKLTDEQIVWKNQYNKTENPDLNMGRFEVEID